MDALITSLIGLLAALVAAVSIVIRRAVGKVGEGVDSVNASVNNRKNGEPGLYEMMAHVYQSVDHVRDRVEELVSWKRTYDGGPLDNGAKAEDFVRTVDRKFAEIHARLEELGK